MREVETNICDVYGAGPVKIAAPQRSRNATPR